VPVCARQERKKKEKEESKMNKKKKIHAWYLTFMVHGGSTQLSSACSMKLRLPHSASHSI
jgi:hypothetical protein